MNWSDYFEYTKDGLLVWKERPADRFHAVGYSKMWNTRFSGRRAGCLATNGYRMVCVNGRKYQEHRIIWEMHNGPIPEDMQIDHINGIKDENRIENLRIAHGYENCMNQKKRKGNTSGYKGVTWNKRAKRWYASITIRGKNIYLGCFKTAEEAHEKYSIAAISVNQHFANTDNDERNERNKERNKLLG